MFESDFLTRANTQNYRAQIERAIEALLGALPAQAYSGKSAPELAALVPEQILPAHPSAETWKHLENFIANSLSLTNPNTIAHLHSPPLLASLAAEVVISALNQSMDSFDQGPPATMLESAMCDWLCRTIGFGAEAGAVFTSGGTQSNFMGLLLARDACIEKRWNRRVQQEGLPADAHRLRFFCSEIAHFSVEKSTYQLGLESNAVVKIPVDDTFRMDVGALQREIEKAQRENLIVAAIVATAGTTDFGSIDPLGRIAQAAHNADAWLHIDAAYGSAMLLSEKHRSLLDGLALADSVSVDFHKKFWQSISCAAFALRDAREFRHLEVHADYLNPESHDTEGIPNLVNRSLATTRRWDALKLWLTFQLIGRETLGAMVDQTLELAAHAAHRIRQSPQLELLHEPQLGCVVFRYIPANAGADSDAINRQIRDQMFQRGEAVLGHTRVRGRQCLKFTCVNPMTTEAQLDDLIARIVSEGNRLEALVPRP